MLQNVGADFNAINSYKGISSFFSIIKSNAFTEYKFVGDMESITVTKMDDDKYEFSFLASNFHTNTSILSLKPFKEDM